MSLNQTIIKEINQRIIFDSRGDKTVETEVKTFSNKGIASCPSGASKSSYEVQNLPSVSLEEALKIFKKEVIPLLIGLDSKEQEKIDEIMLKSDSTENLSKYGGAIILSTSIANFKAAANSCNKPFFVFLNEKSYYKLPLPLGNIIGGGKHAKGKSIDIQEILVTCLNPSNMFEAIEANILVHKKVADYLIHEDPYFAGGKNDEGAWVTSIGIIKSLNIVKKVINEISNQKGYKYGIGLDVAASSLWNKKSNKYTYISEKLSFTPNEQLKYISKLIEEFEIFYVEDPFHEDDFDSFSELQELHNNVIIVGDDLYASNKNRLIEGIKKKSSKGIIIKPNQVGCLTKVLETIKFSKENNIIPIVSHRSGETEDIFISHLAVSMDVPLIKTGTVSGERICKLNELIRIEEMFKVEINKYIPNLIRSN